jgi:hypothetical protein
MTALSKPLAKIIFDDFSVLNEGLDSSGSATGITLKSEREGIFDEHKNPPKADASGG